MIRQLTVRDNISFSAAYRLPVEMTAAQKEDVVNQTLLSLGIDHVQHSLIGDERERGISGGQRKRVNIGIELVALPKVLFLDEPTSGLDSTSSAVLARQLKDIATRQNVTIASVIHQPSIQAFLEFDDLLLLGKGGEVRRCGSCD
ncbi:ABCG24 [Symbiodinium microadriaticum]|nr:ABCG24 [Symbiodinium microadriaticum]